MEGCSLVLWWCFFECVFQHDKNHHNLKVWSTTNKITASSKSELQQALFNAFLISLNNTHTLIYKVSFNPNVCFQLQRVQPLRDRYVLLYQPLGADTSTVNAQANEFRDAGSSRRIHIKLSQLFQ